MTNSLKEVISQYLDRGFGSMNKNDFEVFIFAWLIENKFVNQSDYQLSINLKIPVSKIKRLRYEASLRYPNYADYKSLFIAAMKGARYEKEHVVFAIENIALRQYLRDLLMQKGNFFDSSFNSDIIKISNKDFVILLETICLTKDEVKEINNTINKNSNKDVPHYIVNAVAEIAKNVGGESISELTKLGLESLIPIIKSMFNK